MALQQQILAAKEALVGSAGILLSGFFTIPVAAHLAGATLTAAQGALMSILFFLFRWAWLFCVRLWFSRAV